MPACARAAAGRDRRRAPRRPTARRGSVDGRQPGVRRRARGPAPGSTAARLACVVARDDRARSCRRLRPAVTGGPRPRRHRGQRPGRRPPRRRSAVSPSASALIRSDRSSAVMLPGHPVVGLALRIAAGRRLEIDRGTTAPQPMVSVSSRPSVPGRYFSGVGHHVRDHHRPDGGQRHRLAGGDPVRLVAVLLVAAVVVGVHEDQPAAGEHDHRQVPADGVDVERRLAVHQVSDAPARRPARCPSTSATSAG